MRERIGRLAIALALWATPTVGAGASRPLKMDQGTLVGRVMVYA